MAAVAERNQDATVYVGGLDEKVGEHLLAELFIQGKNRKNNFSRNNSICCIHELFQFGFLSKILIFCRKFCFFVENFGFLRKF